MTEVTQHTVRTTNSHECEKKPKGVAVAYERKSVNGSVEYDRWWISTGYCSHSDIVACPWCGEKLE